MATRPRTGPGLTDRSTPCLYFERARQWVTSSKRFPPKTECAHERLPHRGAYGGTGERLSREGSQSATKSTAPLCPVPRLVHLAIRAW